MSDWELDRHDLLEAMGALAAEIKRAKTETEFILAVRSLSFIVLGTLPVKEAT